jgi:hypothetical protein
LTLEDTLEIIGNDIKSLEKSEKKTKAKSTTKKKSKT